MSSIEDSLPAIGGEYPFTKYASKVKLRVNVIGELELEFKGGIKFYVAKNLERGLGGRMLTVRGYEVSADSSEIGKITISQSDIDTTPPSLLEVTDLLPIFCETMILDFTMTVEKPPGGGPPMQLSNSKPMKLVSNEDVREDRDPALAEDLVRLERRRAVRALDDHPGPHVRGVVLRDLILPRGQDEDVALELEQFGVGDPRAEVAPLERAVLADVRVQSLDVEAAPGK